MIRVNFTRSAIVLNVLRGKGDVVEYSNEEASSPEFLHFAKCHLGTPEEAEGAESHHIRGYVVQPVKRPATPPQNGTPAGRKAATDADAAAKAKAAADEAEFQRLLAEENAKQGATAEAEALLKAAQGQ